MLAFRDLLIESGNHPDRSSQCQAGSVAGPREMLMRRGEYFGCLSQSFEANNDRGEQTGGEATQNSREDAHGGEQEKNSACYRPKQLSGGIPLGTKLAVHDI